MVLLEAANPTIREAQLPNVWLISGGTSMGHIFLSHSDKDHVFIDNLRKAFNLGKP